MKWIVLTPVLSVFLLSTLSLAEKGMSPADQLSDALKEVIQDPSPKNIEAFSKRLHLLKEIQFDRNFLDGALENLLPETARIPISQALRKFYQENPKTPQGIWALDMSGHLANEDVSFEEIQTGISSKRYSTIDNLLRSLPESYRVGHVIGYDTDSILQPASDDKPRGIFHGPTARNLFTFHEDDHSLEWIRFLEDQNDWEFRKIKEVSDPSHPLGKKLILSKPNPQICLKCHQKADYPQARPRPNWDSYFVWRKFYGSVDDNYFNRGGGAKFTRDPEEEKEALEKFLSEGVKGRYQFLTGVKIRYRDETTLFRPNLFLTRRLARLNIRRIAKELSQLEEFDTLKWAILGLIECNTQLRFNETWFPKQIRSKINLKSVFDASSAHDGEAKRVLVFLENALSVFHRDIHKEEWEKNWSLANDLEDPVYNEPVEDGKPQNPFQNGFGDGFGLLPTALMLVDPEIRALLEKHGIEDMSKSYDRYAVRSGTSDKKLCENLKQRSVIAFRQALVRNENPKKVLLRSAQKTPQTGETKPSSSALSSRQRPPSRALKGPQIKSSFLEAVRAGL